MIQPPPSRRSTRMVRPQLAAELLLTLFAIVFAALLLRLTLRLFGVDARAWSRATVDRLTFPFVWPLAQLPGGRQPLLGDATLPDVTVVAICVLLLLVLGAGRRRA
ncbi:MAG TPA: hypothetical protein VFQ80_02595 [Thermomicrobiales bacterium]|jgi:hypothetical protein|nr:hypothetical protein [Thermomicrobiales bacterium]